MPASVFNMLCKASGLSVRDAANLLDIDIRTARDWYKGHVAPPKEALEVLIGYSTLVDNLVDTALQHFAEEEEQHGFFGEIVLNISCDDAQALMADLPPLPLQKTFVGRVMAWAATVGYPCSVVSLTGLERGIYGLLWEKAGEMAAQDMEETFAQFEGHPGLARMH